jgi:hypothetical protein
MWGVNNIDIITNIVNDLSINGVIYDCLFFLLILWQYTGQRKTTQKHNVW